MTLYTGGSDGFVSSTAAPIASGWSEPSSRAGLSPAVVQRLSTAHVQWRCKVNYDYSGRCQFSPSISTESDCVALFTLLPHKALLPHRALKASRLLLPHKALLPQRALLPHKAF